MFSSQQKPCELCARDTSVMNFWENLITRVGKRPACGYGLRQSPASEPTAAAALALLAHGHPEAASPALSYLASCQGESGGVGVRQDEQTPQWPTSLAVLSWCAAAEPRYAANIRRGVAWMLSLRGKVMPRDIEMGHDTTLCAWPWADGTHSWIEPTALAVAAMKAAGHVDHPRTREAVRMLVDRQLPGGGCNYGNTFCLGQQLRPHVQPTGIALQALAGERDASGRIAASISWLAKTIDAQTTTISLAWAVLGLSAHGAAPPAASEWLRRAAERTLASDQSPYKLALLTWAAATV